MYNLGFEDAEKPEIKLPTFTESWRKQSFTDKISSPTNAKGSSLDRKHKKGV